MARSYARIAVDIWDDPDYLELSLTDKLVYQFILEQRKMRSCGVIDLQVKRWAPRLGIGAEEVTGALERLQDARFVLIDQETDEMAVRTFVRHDAGTTKNWKVWAGVWSSLGAVESQMLRDYVNDHMPDESRLDRRANPLPMRDRSGIDDQSITDGIGDQVGDGIGSGNPSPSPTPVPTPPPEPDAPSDLMALKAARAGLYDRTLDALVEHEYAKADDSLIDNPAGYRLRIRNRLERDRGYDIEQMITANPLLTDEHELAQRVLGDYENPGAA